MQGIDSLLTFVSSNQDNDCLHTVGWWNLADTPPSLGGEGLGNTLTGK